MISAVSYRELGADIPYSASQMILADVDSIFAKAICKVMETLEMMGLQEKQENASKSSLKHAIYEAQKEVSDIVWECVDEKEKKEADSVIIGLK